MKLANIKSARAIWLVPINDINQRGRYMLPAITGLVRRYSFQKPPEAESITSVPTKIQFEMGSFESSDGTPIYVNLTVHDDGLVAETRTSTEESNRFLEDVMNWISSEFQLPAISDLGVKRLFVSEVSVVLEQEPSIFSASMKKFAASLGSPVFNRQLHLTHLNFSSDPAESKQALTLRIEREVGTDFSDRRYYSYAHCSTSRHMELLEEFERASR